MLHHLASLLSASTFSMTLLDLYSTSPSRLYLSDFSVFMKRLIPDRSHMIDPLFRFLTMDSLSVPRDTLFFFLVELMLSDKPLEDAVSAFCGILESVNQITKESVPSLFLLFLRVQIQLLNELFPHFVESNGKSINDVFCGILSLISEDSSSNEDNRLTNFIQKQESIGNFSSRLSLWIETDSIAVDLAVLSTSQVIKNRVKRWRNHLGISSLNDSEILPFVVSHATEAKDRYLSCYELLNVYV